MEKKKEKLFVDFVALLERHGVVSDFFERYYGMGDKHPLMYFERTPPKHWLKNAFGWDYNGNPKTWVSIDVEWDNTLKTEQHEL